MYSQFKNMPIRLKLPMMTALMIVLAVLAMGAVSFQMTRTAAMKQAEHALHAVAQGMQRSVTGYLNAIATHITLEADNPYVQAALTDFSGGYTALDNPEQALTKAYVQANPHPEGNRDLLYDGGQNTTYDQAHLRYHPFFHALQQKLGYYDIFLFDTKGTLVYSVFKESDFASNLLSGKWKDSGLGQAYRAAAKLSPNTAPAFVDFTPYGPSAGAPAAFLARPVFDNDGKRLGVLAFQMPVDRINQVTSGVVGLGQSGDAFIVGEDSVLRSDSSQTEENDILTTHVSSASAAGSVPSGGHAAMDIGLNGVPAAIHRVPLPFLGTNWTLAVTQSMDEILAPTVRLRNIFAVIGTLIILVGLLLAAVFARSISTPLRGVGRAMREVAAAHYDLEVPHISRKDEIGGIANALEGFRKSLITASRLQEEAAYKGAAFAASSSAMMLIGTDGRVVWTNQALDRLFTAAADDLRQARAAFDETVVTGADFHQLHPLGDLPSQMAQHAGNDPIQRYFRAGALIMGLAIAAVQDEDGQPIGHVVEWKDQTDDLRNAVIMGSLDRANAQVEISSTGTIVGANDTFAGMLGCAPKDLEGTSANQIITLPGSTAAFEQISEAEEPLFGLFQIAHSGGPRFLDGSLTPMSDHTGLSKGMILIGRDITQTHLTQQAHEAQHRAMTEAQEQVVDALRDALHRVSQKDLTTQIEKAFPKEYSALRDDFNLAISTLSTVIETVGANAGNIDSETSEITSAADDLAQRTETQAATLEETAAALDEITGSVKTAADSTKRAAKLVENAHQMAIQSEGVVDNTETAMHGIAKSSSEITNIISVIDNIAFQTNLLALNAGVEAARAGEAGRGFAVVASEVRALALQSANAAQEITTLISASRSQVDNGVELVGRTGTSLKSIVAAVAEVADLVATLSTSSSDQAAVLQEINASVAKLDAVTQRNAAMFEETTAASHALRGQAHGLSQKISEFNIGQHHVESPQPQQIAS
ncbi:PAS domain-containing protein [Sulfitobacter mediterraneus]|uniref:methyl-accepting chemotaxis protein n=2 Tax=Sulfitobacter mediterraneus TaxID=83219 RepID=UPI0019323A23|nr:methyl-accepting chemotaxis protein [Sulfitobacter mediterraneus]MBM1309617.1 PAS domain-containing protein [Sulfitobacter mediterraneus]MBM1313502.1 PAS domain-containing protein [Sulfitobacter mediterraneus]MBM1321886.1 PAS domain-containing protein [Sulfitobacter mediterraneus]MBM1325773.1 PAS domain-containing protein [Sulfitobacter mediterraneus]MBM1397119.1 PAS domain-containing protein [Sulfitobacter mediterraneus]